MAESTGKGEAVQAAVSAFRKGDFSAVTTILEPVWQAGAGGYMVPKLMGIAWQNQGDMAKAVDFLESAFDMSGGEDGQVSFHLSQAALALKDTERAISAALSGTATMPKVPAAHAQFFLALTSCSTETLKAHLSRWRDGFAPGVPLSDTIDSISQLLSDRPDTRHFLGPVANVLLRAGMTEEAVRVVSRGHFPLEGPEPVTFDHAGTMSHFAELAESYDETVWSLETATQFTVFALEHLGGAGKLRVLDAGCGTGLLGKEIRPLAAQLDGMDLSGKMLEQARKRKIYDSLVESDIVDGMARPDCRESYDLIVCNWCLFYFPSLDGFFSAAAASLAPGGQVLFTVYSCADDADVLRRSQAAATGYSHSRRYLRSLAAANGLREERLEVRSLSVHPGFYCAFSKRK